MSSVNQIIIITSECKIFKMSPNTADWISYFYDIFNGMSKGKKVCLKTENLGILNVTNLKLLEISSVKYINITGKVIHKNQHVFCIDC